MLPRQHITLAVDVLYPLLKLWHDFIKTQRMMEIVPVTMENHPVQPHQICMCTSQT